MILISKYLHKGIIILRQQNVSIGLKLQILDGDDL